MGRRGLSAQHPVIPVASEIVVGETGDYRERFYLRGVSGAIDFACTLRYCLYGV